MGYDCSVKEGRKGCNYCLGKPIIDMEDCRIYIDDELQTLDTEHDNSRMDCCVEINYCPICGKQLRKELL